MEKGQVFKNYKELCKYMNEPIKAGRGKICQMNRWACQFEHHKEGNKIIIDQVYNPPLPYISHRGGAYNRKNLDIYLPYMHQCFYNHVNYNMSSITLICDVLKLTDKKKLNDILHNNRKNTDLSINEFKEFKRWVFRVKKYVQSTIETGLRTLQNDDKLEYSTAYAFISKPQKTRYVSYLKGYDDYILQTEADVCDDMNKKYKLSSKIDGRNLKYVIFLKESWIKEYRNRVADHLLQNNSIKEQLQASINEMFCGINFGSKEYPIQGYWKVWSINGVEEPEPIDMEQARQNYIDLIVKKTTTDKEIPQKWIDLVF